MFVIFLYFNDCDREVNQHLLNQKHLLQSKTLLGLFLDPTKKIVTRPSLQLIHTNSCHITFHQSAPTITSSSCLLLKISLSSFITGHVTTHFKGCHCHVIIYLSLSSLSACHNHWPLLISLLLCCNHQFCQVHIISPNKSSEHLTECIDHTHYYIISHSSAQSSTCLLQRTHTFFAQVNNCNILNYF